MQTAAEIRHNRQKKQVQSGYHRYHAENHTADQLQESGADADQGRPPEPVADAAAKAQDTAVDINSVVDIEEGRGAGAAVPTTNQQRPEPGPAAAARAGAPTFSASESTTPPRARAKASSYQSAFRQDDSEPDGRSRSTFDDGTHKNNPKSAREGQQQQKRQRHSRMFLRVRTMRKRSRGQRKTALSTAAATDDLRRMMQSQESSLRQFCTATAAIVARAPQRLRHWTASLTRPA